MSLFNRPTWAKAPTSAADADDDQDHDSQRNIFSHSGRSYREIVAEQERKKQAKLERKKEKELRKSLEKRQVADVTYEDTSSKRRRISLPEEDEELDTVLGEKEQKRTAQQDTDYLEVDKRDEEILQGTVKPRRSPRKSKTTVYDTDSALKEIISPQIIDLGDSDHEDHNDAPVVQPPAAQVIEDESDDEFAALARRARAQRQQGSNGTSHSTLTADPTTAPASRDAGASVKSPDQSAPDHTVQLLITCSLEGTNPMIIYRKLSQNLEDVRKVWCARQGFSEEATKDVFFIHRLRRVYDVTTCKSLGLEVDAFGNLTLKGAEGKENVDKVHLEAVTEDIFRQMKAERAKGADRRNKDDTADEAADEQPAPQEKPAEECLIRLLLKAKGREDYKLKVRPTTTFAKIVAAYSKTQLQPGQTAHLEFDGERLPPDAEVQDTEVSDMDCIDVHIAS